MKRHFENSENGLTPKQEQAAMMLAAGPQCDRHRGGHRNGQGDSQPVAKPSSGARHNQERQAVRARTQGKIIHLAEKAAATLERLLDSENGRIALSATLGIPQNAEPAAKAEAARRKDCFGFL